MGKRSKVFEKYDFLKSIFDCMNDGVYIVNQQFGIEYVNPALEKDFGSVSNRKCYQYFHDRSDVCPWCKNDEVFAGKTVHWEFFAEKLGRSYELFDIPLINADGSIFKLEFFHDVTDRVEAENLLKESVQQNVLLSDLVERSSQPFGIGYPDGHISIVNEAFAQLTGYSKEELQTIDWVKVLTPPEWTEKENAELEKLQQTGNPVRYEKEYIRKDGSRVPIELLVHLVRDENGQPHHFFAFVTDITERKKSEDQILRSKNLLQNVIDSTPDWIYVKDEKHRFIMVNKSFADAQKLKPQDMIGRADLEFFAEELCLGNPTKGMRGFHHDDDQVLQGEIVHNPSNVSTWADGSHHSYDTFNIPLNDASGRTYHVLCFGRDITERQKAEDELELSYKLLQKTLNDTVEVIGLIVDMRDPYTAGHQRKVAQLTVAIAGELNLAADQIDYMHKAAMLHDIGKMYIPADLLSRPGKLTEIEWSLIKTHAQGSFDILKGIDFKKPIAQIALQHHERMNGSGYPSGLKGEDILIEARILAVADVVEAMSSHRPYRPALGIDKALEEISKNRGKLYDPKVVDTCLELFHSGKFEFKSV